MSERKPVEGESRRLRGISPEKRAEVRTSREAQLIARESGRLAAIPADQSQDSRKESS